MTIEGLRELKNRSRYSNEELAKRSGLPLLEVERTFSEIVDSVNYDTFQAIMDVFRRKDNLIKESAVPYGVKRDGEYTVEDYRALPDECRVELIDGRFFTMEAPSTIHQMLTASVWQPIEAYIRKNKGKCISLFAPVDVQLDKDNKTMVQPDILVLCDKDRLLRKKIWGAPDMVIEICSPSTRRHDSIRKLNKYRKAGVREYWIVDPDKRKIIVYDLEHKQEPVIYGLDQKVPVGIFGGECMVDFAEIYEEIRFLYER